MLNDFKNLGLYRHYKALLKFLTSLGNTQILHYRGQNVVCSSKLKKGLVTTTAVNNFDQSTSFLTATSSSHATVVSATQHPFKANADIL